MARPERRDVDYFPFYVKDGKTLFILESQYGCKGTGFFTNVMRFLCQTPDHHYQIKEDSDRMFFFSRCHCDEPLGEEMMKVLAKTGKIDKDLWFNHGVVVSEDLLMSITDAYRKRNSNIITMSEIRSNFINSNHNPLTTGINTLPSELPDQNGVDNPQSKVKESKGKKKPHNPLTVWPEDFTLTDHLKELASKYIPVNEIEREWEAFKAYSSANGKRYANWEDAWKTRYINYSKFHPTTNDRRWEE
jgi:hypothetical protein